MLKKRKSKYCRLCRKKIESHGNKLYCEKAECKSRYRSIRVKQVKSAKKRFKVSESRKLKTNKEIEKQKHLQEVKSWLQNEKKKK